MWNNACIISHVENIHIVLLILSYSSNSTCLASDKKHFIIFRSYVVCAPKVDYLAIITAYIPSMEEWEGNYKKRKITWNASIAKEIWKKPGRPPSFPHLWPLIYPPPLMSLSRDEEEKRSVHSSVYPRPGLKSDSWVGDFWVATGGGFWSGHPGKFHVSNFLGLNGILVIFKAL